MCYGSGYLESESKVQFSGSCSQDSESQGRNFQGPGTYFQVLGCHDPRVPGSRVPESRVSGSWFKGLRVRGPGSHVLTLDYAFPVPGCQGPRGPVSRVPKSRVSGSQGPGSQSWDPRSRVSGPDFRLCIYHRYSVKEGLQLY